MWYPVEGCRWLSPGEGGMEEERPPYTADIDESSRRQYKKVTRARAEEKTRDALIDSAIDELYGEEGWLKVSLESLSAKAGVTKQTLLRHFGSKDGLLMHALLRSGSQVLDQRWSTLVDDIEGAVDNLLDHYEAWGERARSIGAWESGPPPLANLSRLARQVHYDWVEHAFARWLEPLSGEAREHRRAGLIALCDVQTWHLLHHDMKLKRAAVRAILVDLIERAVDAR